MKWKSSPSCWWKNVAGGSAKKQFVMMVTDTTNMNCTTDCVNISELNDDTKKKISESKKNVSMSIDSSQKKSVQLKGKPWSEARRLAAQTQRKTGPKPK